MRGTKTGVLTYYFPHGIDAGIQLERTTAGSHPKFVGWGYIAFNVVSEADVARMADLERMNGILLSSPRMTKDAFHEAVITDLDPNRDELVGCDLLKAAFRSLYRVV